jgi:hypothetical protein
MAGEQVNNAMTLKQLIADQNRLLTEQNQIAKDRLSTDRSITDEQQDISNVLKDQLTQLKFQKAEKSAILRATNSISKISENLSALGKEDLTNARSLKKLDDNKLSVTKNINSLRQVQSKLIKDSAGLDATRAELNLDLANSIEDQINRAIALKVELELVNNTVQNIANAKGVSLFGGIEKVLDKIPLLSGLAPMFGAAAKEAEGIAADMEKRKFGADQYAKLRKEGMGMEDALKESGASIEDIQENMKGGFSKAAIDSASMAAGAKEMLNSFMKSLGPVAMIIKLVSAMIEGDKAASDMAKGLNMSYKDSLAMRGQLREAAVDSGNVFVSTKGMSESMMEMNKALGTSVTPSKEMLTQFTEMREMAGFTNEELLGIKAISDSTGKSLNEISGEYMAQAQISSTALGVKLNEKDLLKDIGKISAATTLSLGKNPALIADAVATTKALGMEMSKVDAIAGSLLDFESSIENELSAELLLNKDLNLEKARQYALNNDLAGVAREISEQAGSAAEFTAMNRIQQEALAKAVGMGREDLAKTLFVQEQLAGATGDQAAETEALLNKRIEAVGLEQAQKEEREGGLENLLNQATATEKMNASMDQMNESLMILGSALQPIVSMFAGIAGFIAESKIATIAFGAALGALGAIATVMAVRSTITAITGIFSSFSSIPFGLGIPAAIGTVAALGGIIGGVGSMIASAGDVNSPAKGKTQISTKEGGLFELSQNDDIVAFPGASQMAQNAQNNMSQNNNQTVQNNTVVENKTDMSATNALLAQLIKKTPEMAPLGMYEIQ